MAGSRSDRGQPHAATAAVAALVLMLVSGGARADNTVTYKRARVYEAKDLRISVGFREMFDAQLRKRLKSGFATTVVMRVYLYRKRDGAPVSLAVRTLKAYYDPWDEEYLLKTRDHRGATSRRFRDQRAIVDRLTSLWRFPIARIGQIQQGAQYFVAVIAEVNPVDERLLAEVRRWLRNPHGGHRQVGGESFFGSFVSIFVGKQLGSADRSLLFRSRVWVVPK